MSYWFILDQINRQAESVNKRKVLSVYFFLPTILVISGIWFVFFILNSRGILPFKNPQELPSQTNLGFFSPSVQYWEVDIFYWAETWAIDPLLVATVMQIESCGDPYAISSAGAQGLFQVMPFHFAPDEEILNPQTNALRGLDYLSSSFNKSKGNIEHTLAGYNGGHGQIDRYPAFWPDETKRYVLWGSAIYQDAATGNDSRESLKAWLEAGGWWLCQQAEHNLELSRE